MSVAKWFLIPAVCAALAISTASTALAANKHHRAKAAPTKPVAMSKTHAAHKKQRPAVKKKSSRKKLKPASHAVKRSSLKSQMPSSGKVVAL